MSAAISRLVAEPRTATSHFETSSGMSAPADRAWNAANAAGTSNPRRPAARSVSSIVGDRRPLSQSAAMLLAYPIHRENATWDWLPRIARTSSRATRSMNPPGIASTPA